MATLETLKIDTSAESVGTQTPPLNAAALNIPARRVGAWGLGFFGGSIVLIGLTLLVAELDWAIANAFRASGVVQNPLEYPLTAVAVGLIANTLLRMFRLYRAIQPAVRTELYLKTGVVLLGARISLGDLLATGAGGVIQAVIVVTSVFLFTWWLTGKLKFSNTFRAVMAAAVSLCGVAAALAAAGVVKARKEEVTYVAALVIVTSIPLMVLMPPLAHALNVPPTIAGAWFGANIDTTAAVVGAGTALGPKAQETATVVKLTQNVLIGFAAFALAIFFAFAVNQGVRGEEPRPRILWDRFPKFVIGFVLVMLFSSAGWVTPALAKEIDTASKWLFTLSFVCIGLDFSLRELLGAGWRPAAAYLVATVFNTVFALGAAYVVFGVLFPR